MRRALTAVVAMTTGVLAAGMLSATVTAAPSSVPRIQPQDDPAPTASASPAATPSPTDSASSSATPTASPTDSSSATPTASPTDSSSAAPPPPPPPAPPPGAPPSPPTVTCTMTVAYPSQSVGQSVSPADAYANLQSISTVDWTVADADSVTVDWFIGDISTGILQSVTAQAPQTASSGSNVSKPFAPALTAQRLNAKVTATNSAGSTSWFCLGTIPALPGPPTLDDVKYAPGANPTSSTPDVDYCFVPSGSSSCQGRDPQVVPEARGGWSSVYKVTSSVSPAGLTCPTTTPATVTLTGTPQGAFASLYPTITTSKTVQPTCVTTPIVYFDYQSKSGVPASGGSDPLVIFGSAPFPSGASASAEFIDWRGQTAASSPFDFANNPPTAAIPTAVDMRCIARIELGQLSANLTSSVQPVPGPYDAAKDKAYCEKTFPAPGATTPAVPPGGSSSTTPSASGTSGASGTSTSRPATTGGGGASSGSAGAPRQTGSGTTTSDPAGGPGAAPQVKVHSAPCLADGSLYDYMAGSVGSSFVMAPDLRNRPIPVSFAITSGSLPEGIRLDEAAGVVYGVPRQTDSGATPITIRATNPDGTTVESTFTFAVDDPHHSVSYPVRVIAGVNEPVDVYQHSKGNSGPASYSLVCGTMPQGLTLDPKTGVIAGTPTIEVQYPIPLRIRQSNNYGWVDSSMMLLVGGAANPWLTYPHHVTIARGTTRTIRPTIVGLPNATFELSGTLPRGLRLNPATGAINGKPAAITKRPAEVTVSAMLPDGTVAASDTLQITVRKRAVPLAVSALQATKKVSPSRATVVVQRIRHSAASRVSVKVICSGCKHTVQAKTGRVVVRPGATTSSVKVIVTAKPVGKRNKAAYRSHVWARKWSVR
jgi:hypothetical protein